MLEGKPAGESETVTMNAIRTVMSKAHRAAVERVTSEQSAPVPGVPVEGVTVQPVSNVETKVRPARFSSVPEGVSGLADSPVVAGAEASGAAPQSRAQRAFGALATVEEMAVAKEAADSGADASDAPSKQPMKKSRLSGIISTNRLIWLAIIGIVIVRPDWIFLGILMWAVFVVGAFLLVGADRIWRAISWAAKRRATKAPDKGAKLYAWLESVADRWDRVLDCFPDGMVDTLYMPDFANFEPPKAAHKARVEAKLQTLKNDVVAKP